MISSLSADHEIERIANESRKSSPKSKVNPYDKKNTLKAQSDFCILTSSQEAFHEAGIIYFLIASAGEDQMMSGIPSARATE